VEDVVANRDTRSLPERTKDMASAAGEAIGQAVLNVTHLAVNQAHAAVALADHAIYGVPAATTKRRTAKKRAALATTVRTRKARRAK
jgi:hypothetical protein